MTDKPEDGGPAFPRTEDAVCHANRQFDLDGMTLRQYAAIKLKVPDSGLDWLDEMIVKAKRMEIAGQAVMRTVPNKKIGPDANKIASYAYEISDSIIGVAEEKNEENNIEKTSRAYYTKKDIESFRKRCIDDDIENMDKDVWGDWVDALPRAEFYVLIDGGNHESKI